MGTVVKEKKRGPQRAENNSVQTKGGGGWTTFLTLNAKRVKEGRFLVRWYYQYRLQAGSTSRPKFRTRVDSNAVGNHTAFGADQEWQENSGWDIMRFNKGDQPVIDIQCRRVGGSNTIEMRRLKISLEKWGPDGN